jgi:CPA1 family monovalent cation:H+ antiporter
VVRIGWVFLSAVFGRWRWNALQERLKNPRPRRPPRARPERPARSEREAVAQQERARRRGQGGFEPQAPFSWRENLVIGWTGMRGVVTLAAAAGIPLVTATGEPFPGRDVIQIVAFVVTIGTLLVQGLTLPWLIKVLGISDPEEEETHAAQTALAEELARQASIDAVTAYRDKATDEPSRRLADGMLRRMSAEPKPQQEVETDGNEPAILALANEILAARRTAIVKARDERKLDDEVMREVLEQMDLEQAVMANWSPGRFGRG